MQLLFQGPIQYMSNRIDESFSRCRTQGTGALMPYITACYPAPSVSEAIILQADSLGSAVVEIGFPFSDAIADGPVIQDSFHATLLGGHKVDDVFDMIERIRPKVSCALVAMVSHSIVYRIGTEAFFARAAGAGFAGVILPDVPVEEAEESLGLAEAAGLCHIGLVAPTTTDARRATIAQRSTGFVYQIASEGTTGERKTLRDSLEQDVSKLRKLTSLPVCVGFGIATASQVREVLRFADGAIVGSAIVRRISDGVASGATHDEIVGSVGEFLAELMTGTEANG